MKNHNISFNQYLHPPVTRGQLSAQLQPIQHVSQKAGFLTYSSIASTAFPISQWLSGVS